MGKQFTIILSMILLFSSCEDDRSRLGDKYFKEGKYREAVQVYTEFLQMMPSHLKTIYNRGRAYEELGQYAKAMEDFQRTLKIDPKNVSAMLSIGNHHYRIEDFDQALFYFEKASVEDGTNAQAFFLKARSNHRLGNIRDALIDYNNVININRNYGEAYLYRGALRAHIKSFKGACKDFKLARALNVLDAEEAIEKYCH